MLIALGNILLGIAAVLEIVLDFVMILIIARVIISWVNADPFNPIVRFVSTSTDPLMKLVRRKVPLVFGSLDLSPFLVVLIIVFLRYAVVRTLQQLAMGMG